MPSIHEYQLSEVIPFLPEIQVFDPAHCRLEKQFTLLLCTLGFEPRGLLVPEMLAQHGYQAARVIYFDYATNRDDNAANRPRLLQYLNRMTIDVQSLNCDDQGFSRRLSDLLESCVGHVPTDEANVFFDISGVANRLLIRCMKVLLTLNVRLTLFYSEAAKYYPTREEYEDNPEKWESEESLGLERGVSDVILSEEYPGYHIDQLPDCVILFPSFNKERARAVISEIDPSLLIDAEKQVLWILEVPHLEDDRWRLDAMRKINQLTDASIQYQVSTFDYRDSLRTLDTIYQDRIGQYKFTLSSMGSKMQALGAALFCYLRPDVRVVFAIPREYNAGKYSDGCKATWIIDFDSTSKLRSVLDQVGTIKIEE